MRQRAVHAAMLAIMLALPALTLVGCGASTAVSSAWEGPRTTVLPRRHLLVVGVSPNSRIRRSFEVELARLLGSTATQATPAVKVGAPAAPLDAASVGAMVRGTGADTVLVTRLVSRRVGLEESRGRVGVKTQVPANINDSPTLVDLFRLEYNEYEEPGEITAKSTAVVETSVYDARDGGRLFYRVTTTSEFDEERDDVIAEVAGAIARQLRRDGLVR